MSFVVRNDRMFNAFIVAVVVPVVERLDLLFFLFRDYTGDDDDDDAEDNLTTMQSIIHLEEQKRKHFCAGAGAPSHKVDIHQMLFMCVFCSRFSFHLFISFQLSLFLSLYSGTKTHYWRAHAPSICNASRSYYYYHLFHARNWIINAFYKTEEGIKATHISAPPAASRQRVANSFQSGIRHPPLPMNF